MGQYGNQPDFGVRATSIIPQGDTLNGSPGPKLNGAALYVGTGGTTLIVTLTGGPDGGSFTQGATVFTNVPSGTFLPIIVDYVWSTGDDGAFSTDCDNIVALY
jgi:hypothetical protein